MHDDINKDPFEEYEIIKQGTQGDLLSNWETAIGLQKVDRLETSSYLKETALRNINGEITLDEVQNIIESYYNEDRKRENPLEAEADIVSTRIAQLLDRQGFSFSVEEFINIHKYLFEGTFKFAGKIRDYDISKKEWVLGGDTVVYGSSSNLLETLKYDFDEESNFDYSKLNNIYERIHRLSIFISRIWQVHVFGEGNTRTTAVFLIKYLRTKGYDVTNDIFKKYSWYFRNALVRANYSNFKLGVYETTEYLELFLRNLLLNENNELKNRFMHIAFQKNKEEVLDPNDAIKGKYIELMKKEHLSQKTINYTISLYDKFGFAVIFGRTDVVNSIEIEHSAASDLIKKLKNIGIIVPMSGFGKGKYKFQSL